ncbi:MAG TPA: pilin [Patescibacteria group bacterium]|nr:pilin [Patescibacteria group bacterium]
MKKTLVKNLLSFALIVLILVPVFVFMTNGANAQIDVGINEVENTIELGNKDPRETVGEIINVAMLFLGIIAVGIILVGGFKWMTAGGSEEKVGEAKKLMGSGVIGLVIVLSAWGIASFILDQLINATGN